MNLNNCLFQFSNYSNYFFESSFSLFIYITTYISIIYIILERELVPLFLIGKLENWKIAVSEHSHFLYEARCPV